MTKGPPPDPGLQVASAAEAEPTSRYPAPVFGLDASTHALWVSSLELGGQAIHGNMITAGASLVSGLSYESYIPILFRFGGGSVTILAEGETVGFMQLELATGGFVEVTPHIGLLLELRTGVDVLLRSATGNQGSGGILVEAGGRFGVRVDLGNGGFVTPFYDIGFAGLHTVGFSQGVGVSLGFDMGREYARSAP